MTRTLVKFTLRVAFQGPQDKDHLAELADRLVDLVRGDEDTLSVRSDFASVEAEGDADDLIDDALDY